MNPGAVWHTEMQPALPLSPGEALGGPRPVCQHHITPYPVHRGSMNSNEPESLPLPVLLPAQCITRQPPVQPLAVG